MALDPNTMSERDTHLHSFLIRPDRGIAKIFVGRKEQLDEINRRLQDTISAMHRPSPGKDSMMVVQGAPGAGKSAILSLMEEKFPITKSSDIPTQPNHRHGDIKAVNISSNLLCETNEVLVASIVRQISRQEDETLWQKSMQLLSVLNGLNVTGTGLSWDWQKWPLLRTLEKQMNGAPLLLLIDEVQDIGKRFVPRISTNEPMSHEQQRIDENLKWLHEGSHGLPIVPLFGGLANSADIINSVGPTRLSANSIHTLQRFGNDTITELFDKFMDQYLTDLKLPSDVRGDWLEAMKRDTHGWPMHCNHFLKAIGGEVQRCDWEADKCNLDHIRRQAAGSRFEYYQNRLEGVTQDRQGVISYLLESIRKTGPQIEDEIIETLSNCPPIANAKSPTRWQKPSPGVEAKAFFDHLVHKGVIQKDDDEFSCPIPSLASHMAAMSAVPYHRLHRMVLKASCEEIHAQIEKQLNAGGLSGLLKATDPRGRTPLMLAIEMGINETATVLINAELSLPVDQRSFDMKDKNGLTARELAAQSEDVGMADFVEFLKPKPSMEIKNDDRGFEPQNFTSELLFTKR